VLQWLGRYATVQRGKGWLPHLAANCHEGLHQQNLHHAECIQREDNTGSKKGLGIGLSEFGTRLCQRVEMLLAALTTFALQEAALQSSRILYTSGVL